MVCPKCKSENIQPISETPGKYYCVACNYAWDFKNEDKEPQGTLNFTGVVPAERLFDVMVKEQDISPELRAALKTQFIGILFENWFEGLKAGQMLSILHAKEYYGKDRNGTDTTIRSSEVRDDGPERKDTGAKRRSEAGTTRAGQRRRSEDGGAQGYRNSQIRKRIGPVEVCHPREVPFSESLEKLIAHLSQNVWGNDLSWIKNITYDGKLIIEVNLV